MIKRREGGWGKEFGGTWYSKARWREGRKISNSKYWRVSGSIKSASFLAFITISSPYEFNNEWNIKWSVEVIKSLTGNNSATTRSNFICPAYRPLRRRFFSHLKSGYFSCIAFSRSALRSVDGPPMFFRSASVIEYQSEGFDVKRGIEGVRMWWL